MKTSGTLLTPNHPLLHLVMPEDMLPHHVEDVVKSAVDDPGDRNHRVESWRGKLDSGTPVRFLRDEMGMAGWAGWIPYQEEPGTSTWQTSTYLAPRWRGRGLFPLLRTVEERLIPPNATGLVVSVNALNARSVTASRRDAQKRGWGAGRIVWEPVKGRYAVVWRWETPVPQTRYIDDTSSVDSPLEDLINVARTVTNPQRVSKYFDFGGVAAAVETTTGRVYTGVCIDTTSSMGMCAEVAAAANMLTHGETEVARMAAVNSDGNVLPPCGKCREFFSLLNANPTVATSNTETARLSELLPHDWKRV